MSAREDLHAIRSIFPSHASWDPGGAMALAGLPLADVAARWGTPAYLLDEDDIRARARAFRQEFGRAFRAIGADADVYYAGKAFLCTAMVRLLQDEGLRLDVCSGGELAVARRAGFPGEQIGLHGNNKSMAEIEAAIAYGVGRIVVDSFEEIERVAAVARRAAVVAPVMIRVKTGVEAHTHEFIATAHEDQKFGLSLTEGEVAEAAAMVLRHSDALSLLGFHSHIGSQIFESSGFAVAAQRLIGAQLEVARQHGVTLPELDLGGGFGIAYVATDTPLSPRDMADQLAEVVVAACREAGMPVPRVSIEPGRAIVGPAGATLYEVGTVKPVVAADEELRTYVSVDGGMSDNVRPALYGADYTCLLAGREGSDEQMRARVVGKHCESGDIVVNDGRLPADTRPGDLLAVAATGAYCRSLASQYNHVPRPPVLAVRAGEVTVWLRRETIDDLLALEGE
ncbi:diaminopimelate decarboxylase [Leekyejoonella antrihumi]|uniref:Diaminopimelate decarboxylase n=1 Tax=Leekyejoonella antrihumi TaxID=1660198 RepID=A0A563E2G7_9MICO|nr:diaminopimelate decarboxylase [Leekyejoonella antrihumi]TWP36489.1 diaminopimelate decarboxylase [Leekyejoonella antrihumi]